MKKLLPFCVLLAAGGLSVRADTYWQGTTGSWWVSSNWTNGVPQGWYKTYIHNGGTVQLASGNAKTGNFTISPSGTGYMEQTGGSLTISESPSRNPVMEVGNGTLGRYTLSGGTLTGYITTVGAQGVGEFIHSGGRHLLTREDSGREWPRLSVGVSTNYPGAEGCYELSGTGVLEAFQQDIGEEGIGRFIQTGGSNTADDFIKIGDYGFLGTGRGSYELHGGDLNAAQLLVGVASSYSNVTGDGLGSFEQSGGTCTAGYVRVNHLSRMEVTGGALEIADSAEVNGELAFSGTPGAVPVTLTGGIINLSSATVTHPSGAGVSASAGTLLIHPAGFDPATDFGSFSSAGMVHEAGGPLTVGAAEGFSGRGTIADFVETAGTITAATNTRLEDDRAIYMTGGVRVTGGAVDLGRGRLTINDTASGMTGGSLAAMFAYVGETADGSFTQTGGRLDVEHDLVLAVDPGTQGTYAISGGEFESYSSIDVGSKGDGRVQHTGGTVRLLKGSAWSDGRVRIGVFDIGSGLYELSGTGRLEAVGVEIGRSGTGVFRQTGGYAEIQEVYVAYGYRSQGVVDVQGGTLRSDFTYVGYDSTGTVHQSGGVYQATDTMILGHEGTGVYNLSGGTLMAATLQVGNEAAGTLSILTASATVIIAQSFKLNADIGQYGRSYFTAAPGSRIHMVGGSYHNESTTEENVAGLANVTLSFEGRELDIATAEAASEDLGAVYERLSGNFALGGILVSGGTLRLTDEFDNGNRRDSEALYAHTLRVGDEATLMLDGLTMYAGIWDRSAGYNGTVIEDGGKILPAYAGDCNFDGKVDIFDAFLLNAAWGCGVGDPHYNLHADFNQDGAVNIMDAFSVEQNWGVDFDNPAAGTLGAPPVGAWWSDPSLLPGDATDAVPEPASGMGVGLILTCMLCRRRGRRTKR